MFKFDLSFVELRVEAGEHVKILPLSRREEDKPLSVHRSENVKGEGEERERRR